MKKLATIVCLALAALAAGGCAALRAPETQEQFAAQAQKLVGTDKVLQRFDAAEERAQLAYAFSWLMAEKQGISETQARDWLAGRSSDDSESSEDSEESPADVDDADFAQFQWKFGGVDGSKAKLSSPRISGLKVGASSISYKWDKDLSAWGLAKDQATALACWFVEKEDGSIVGGKFEWIATSRRTRSLDNVLTGYGGWKLDGVPNPCRCWFVVVSEDGKLRSNVVGAEWKR